jgi:hypothetical protein
MGSLMFWRALRAIRRRIALAAVLMMALAPQARAEAVDFFQAFDDLCLKSTPTVEIARAAGFATLPPFMASRFTGKNAKDAQTLGKVVDGKMMVAVLKDGPLGDGSKLNGVTCVLYAAPMDPVTDLKLETLLGVGPGEPKDNGSKTIAYADGAEGRRRLDLQSAEADESIAAGKLHMIIYGSTGSTESGAATLLMNLTPRPR